MSRCVIPFVAAPGDSDSGDWVAALQRAIPEAQIVAFDAMSTADKAACTVAVVANPRPADLQQLPRLQWVHSVWAGVEGLVADLSNTSLTIVRLVDPALAATMAEAVLAWTLYLHRDMPVYAQQQRQRRWHRQPYIPAHRKTVGLLGLGALGVAASERLATAGFRTCGWQPRTQAVARRAMFLWCGRAASHAGPDRYSDLPASTHAPNQGVARCAATKLVARVVRRLSRTTGAHFKDEDLRDALDQGHLSRAVLDVFDVEPLPDDRWQWTHPRVTVLPHCSAPADMQSASRIVAARIRAYLATGVIPAGVDADKGTKDHVRTHRGPAQVPALRPWDRQNPSDEKQTADEEQGGNRSE